MTPITSPQTLGDVLQYFRKKQNLTQIDISRLSHIRQATVSELENGAPGIRIETLFRTMTALGLEMQLVPRDTSAQDKAAWE